jgi:hypothetical protein
LVKIDKMVSDICVILKKTSGRVCQMILTCNSAVASLMLSRFLRGCIPEQWCNDWHNKLVFDVLWKACTIEEKSEGWLALNQDNVSKWSYMSTHILVSMS